MVGILDYGMGNLRSVLNATLFVGASVKIVSKAADFETISHLIIPGVGAFNRAMLNLTERDLVEPVKSFVQTGKPVLGICLGMQLLATFGSEPVQTVGLNLIQGSVEKFPEMSLRIPHVGWNSISLSRDHYLFNGVKDQVDFYFVHSYFFNAVESQDVVAYSDYGIRFPSVVQKGNIVGIQFHPEKSQKNGLKIIENFWRGPDA